MTLNRRYHSLGSLSSARFPYTLVPRICVSVRRRYSVIFFFLNVAHSLSPRALCVTLENTHELIAVPVNVRDHFSSIDCAAKPTTEDSKRICHSLTFVTPRFLKKKKINFYLITRNSFFAGLRASASTFVCTAIITTLSK